MRISIKKLATQGPVRQLGAVWGRPAGNLARPAALKSGIQGSAGIFEKQQFGGWMAAMVNYWALRGIGIQFFFVCVSSYIFTSIL